MPSRLSALKRRAKGAAQPPAGGGKTASSRIRSWLQAILLLLLAGYVVRSLAMQADQLSAVFSLSSLPWLAAAALLGIGGNLLIALRLMVLLRQCGQEIGLRKAVAVTFAGEFANNFLPAGTGTDAARLFYLRLREGQNLSSIGGLIILDRILGLIGLGLLACASSLLLSVLLPDAGQAAWAMLTGSVLLLVGLISGLLCLRVGRLFEFFHRLCGRLWFGKAFQGVLMGLHQQSLHFRHVLYVLALAVLGHVLGLAMVGVIAGAIMGPGEALDSALLAPLVLFASSIPVTPGNLGWTEALADKTWAIFGLQGGLIVFLARRAVNMLVSLGGCTSYFEFFGQGKGCRKDV